jgi:hypothetical protein
MKVLSGLLGAALGAATIFFFVTAVHAQEKPKLEQVKPLDDKEKLAVRSAQLKLQQAQSALIASPQYQAFQARQQALQQTVDALYAAHKVTVKEVALCDGPAPGDCAKALEGDLTLQPVEKEKK